uniref:hypothetical protein n=1 Tax=Candidatus Roseilinea sp. TaxID=2838777 RepID=UPI00404AA90E
MRLVDADRCFQLIDQMVLAIPEEIRKAQKVEQEHDRIVAQAHEEAERIREMAREEAAQLADDTTIVTIAQNRAEAIEERARREADRLRAEADNYALDTLLRLREEMEHITAVVNNGIAKLEREFAERQQQTRNSLTEPDTAQTEKAA